MRLAKRADAARRSTIAALCFAGMLACGGNKSTEAAPTKLEIKDGLCFTKGTGALGAKVTEPTVRAVGIATTGDAATLTFVYRGDTEQVRELASGQARRQLGLKLRAQNGCNLVYVMWRLDPKPAIDVSVKYNPGARSHKDCGANGYTKIKPAESTAVPELVEGGKHVLRGAIDGDELRVWIDDALAWRGTLPENARTLAGPSGFRSDNLAFDLVAFDAPKSVATQPAPKCTVEDGD